MNKVDRFLKVLVLIGIAGSVSCSGKSAPSSYSYGTPGVIRFHDEVENNTEVVDDITVLEFVDTNGKITALKEFIGSNQNTIVVVTRGYPHAVCLFCSAQTSRLIKRYDEFKKLKTEIVLVYPVEAKENAGDVNKLLDSARKELNDSTKEIPFPVLVDVELKAVNKLGIKDSLSKPATYILDKNGKVRFAYVGKSANDRPSVDAMVNQVKQLNKG